jgi:hypothetical protein
MMNRTPGMPGKGPKNNRYFNIYSNNAQSYLNGVKAMKGGSIMSQGRRPQFKIPGMKNMHGKMGNKRSMGM